MRKRAGPQPQHDSIGDRLKSHENVHRKNNHRRAWKLNIDKTYVCCTVSQMSKYKSVTKQTLWQLKRAVLKRERFRTRNRAPRIRPNTMPVDVPAQSEGHRKPSNRPRKLSNPLSA